LRIFFLSIVLFGCASYSTRIIKPRNYLESGQYNAAIEELKKLVSRNDTDLLLYLLDLGTAYHLSGNYKEAIETFHKADRLAEIKDYTSLIEESASILLSDEVKPYKGENFEKILINMYLAIDYTLIGDFEAALVEARRVNHKLDLMISKGGLPYEQNAFAKFLAAVLFEAQGEYNDAFVDYRQLYKWKGELPFLGIGLLRMASQLGAEEEYITYKSKFGDVTDYKLKKGYGEIVLICEQGKAPVKVEHYNFRLLPMFIRRHYTSQSVLMRISDSSKIIESYPFFDIENTAIKELDHKTSLIVAKKIGGYILKEIVANQVAERTKSKLLGALTSFVLHATDTADLRSWTTLPARLHLARTTVPVGVHDVVLDVVKSNGGLKKEAKVFKNIVVKDRKITFLHYRTEE